MKTIILSLLAIISLFLFELSAQDYTIDNSHSAVLMKVQRFGVVHVIGRFGDVQGTLTYDRENEKDSKVVIEVHVDSYTANNPGGEESAKGPAFLDAANHPVLSFTTTDVMKEGNSLKLSGDISIHGVTKQISFPVRITGPKMDLPTQKQSIALSGVFTINRLDFGVGPDRNLPDGTEIIGNTVEITLELLAITQ